MRSDKFTAQEFANVDEKTVRDFGKEWSAFDHGEVEAGEIGHIFGEYFDIFPWHLVGDEGIGADIGCGSGRWARFVAPKVGYLHLVDASDEALSVAKANLGAFDNLNFICASVGDLPFDDQALDFVYSLGVLHHVPNTEDAVREIYKKLRPGGVFLVYLYYALDNRPVAFRLLWLISDFLRKVICRLPFSLKLLISQLIAAIIYWPLARIAKAVSAFGRDSSNLPLSYYKDKPFYVMRTDSLDRFGTRLEKRFSKLEIERLLSDAGFTDVKFSSTAPFWCATAIKSNTP